MMRYRTLQLLLLLSAVGLSVASCLHDEVGGIRLVTSQESEVYSVARQVAGVTFYAGGTWTATPSVSWLDVEPAQGEGGAATLRVMTTERNTTGQMRLGSLVISSGGNQQLVNIRQRGEYAYFEQRELVMPAEGGLLDVTFRTNAKDSLKLYVTAGLEKWLVDTRKEARTRTNDYQGSLKWLRVQPNDSSSERRGLFLLSLNDRYGLRIDLDTLVFRQLALETSAPDSVPAVDHGAASTVAP